VAKTDLDPFRTALGIIAANRASDTLVAVATAAGLRVDLSLTEAEAYSNKTRVRALLPKILAAYDALPEDSQLAAARLVITNLARIDNDLSAKVIAALEEAGWLVVDGELTASEPELREMFFPRGSQWDAFVVIRDQFLEATAEITIVDAYADGTVFQILDARPPGPLRVRILCSQYADALGAEARRFTAQHPGVEVEVRSARDFHDRFLVLDGRTCIHVGASINNAGRTAFMISRVDDPANQAALLASLEASWTAGTPFDEYRSADHGLRAQPV
jgi:hypothetical protein